MKPVIFSDVDGTLCFNERIHGIKHIRKHLDGTVIVRDPVSGNTHEAYDVSVGTYQAYMAVESRRLAHRLREGYNFVLVTGARPSTVHTRKDYFDFADAIILENGGMIYDNHFSIDPFWHRSLEAEREQLADVAQYLKSQSWSLDDQGRTSAIRVRREDNWHKAPEQYDELRDCFELPSGLKKTSNLGSLDIILRSAGKENAVRFVMQNQGYQASDTIAIGDDINDLGFLRMGGRRYVLANSYPEVIAEAQKSGWYISEGNHFDGINEILNQILAS